MTPTDIATDITRFSPAGSETVNLSTNFTYSWGKMDDSNTWD